MTYVNEDHKRRRFSRHFPLQDQLGFLAFDVELSILFKASQVLEMAKGNISYTADHLRTIRSHHLLQIRQESLVDRKEIIHVPKERFGLVGRDNGCVFASSKVA